MVSLIKIMTLNSLPIILGGGGIITPEGLVLEPAYWPDWIFPALNAAAIKDQKKQFQ